MLNGIMFISEGILSLDIQVTLSKYYKIENIFRSVGQSHMDSDFFIIDSDFYPKEELKNIITQNNLNPNVKIIALTSQPEDRLRKSFQCSHVISKPYDKEKLLLAIEN
jgi:hypothetical protein